MSKLLKQKLSSKSLSKRLLMSSKEMRLTIGSLGLITILFIITIIIGGEERQQTKSVSGLETVSIEVFKGKSLSDPTLEKKNNFLIGEPIIATFSGLDEKVTYELKDTNDATIQKLGVLIDSQQQSFVVLPKNLERGSYSITIQIDGKSIATKYFEIR